jgi:hypothetical protein
VLLEVALEIDVLSDVILKVFAVTLVSKLVMLDVLAAILVENVPIVAELTPPTLLTIGAVAVPPKSFVNLSIPFVLASASGIVAPLETKAAFTNAVVAI